MLTGGEIVAIIVGLFGMMGAFFVYVRDVKRIEADEIQKKIDADAKEREDKATRTQLLESVTDATFKRLKTLLDDANDRLEETEKRLGKRIDDLEGENKELRKKVQSLTEENAQHIQTIRTLTERIEQSERKNDEK